MKYTLIDSENINKEWVKIYYRKYRGRIIHSCRLLKRDFEIKQIPKWFGELIYPK